MKKYFLFLLIGFLTLIPGVKAEEYISCDDYLVGTVSLSNYVTNWYSITPLVPVSPSTTYYLRFLISEDFTTSDGTRFANSPHAFDKDGNSLRTYSLDYMSWDSDYHIFTFKTPNTSGLAFLKMFVYSYNTNYTILENAKFIISDNVHDVIACSNEPEEPEPVVSDSTLDTFYSIYLDKLGMLSSYATENKFIFSAIGIIILFIVLEFFLILFKGRSRY